MVTESSGRAREVQIDTPQGPIMGNLVVPDGAIGTVLFAHGSGSGRNSPRNNYVAQVLQQAGLGTLLMDLLTEGEERVDLLTRQHRFDIALLAQRLLVATDWLRGLPEVGALPFGYFGSSTGAAAAIVAAAQRDDICAIVSRGGRVDMAAETLGRLSAPILMIVGGRDPQVEMLNRQAMRLMRAPARLEIIPGAGHLFEGPGELEAVARLAADWFVRHMGG